MTNVQIGKLQVTSSVTKQLQFFPTLCNHHRVKRLLPVLCVLPLLLVGVQQADANHLWGKPQKYIDGTLSYRIHRLPHKFDRLRLEPASRKRPLPDSKSNSRKDASTRKKKPCPEKGIWTDCFGTFKSDDGTKYVGEWKEDASHGHGTETYANGDKYVGNWKEGKYHGFGVKTYADGRVEKGQWAKNELKDFNSEIDEIISGTNLLSVLYFDGEKVLIDRKSRKIYETTKLFSHSMSKNLVGYLLGHAICEGKVGSVGDTVQKYLKLTSGTPWGNKTLRQMINMQAGNLFGGHKTLLKTTKKVKQLQSLNKGGFFPDYQKWDFLPDYAVLMHMDATTIMRSIKKARGIREDKTLEHNYADINADIVFNIIALTTKGDTRGFIKKHLAERAGTTGEMTFSKDRDGWLKGYALFHSTRKDWLRLGIMIAEDWKSDT